METKEVAIVGAGVSGLLACKHCMGKGLNPVVFESESELGGIWSKTLESTKLQTPKNYYQFSDFPWLPSVKETFPDHTKVLEYLRSYASHFNLLPQIKFNTKVISLDYSTSPDFQDLESRNLWGGSGDPFSATGKWNLTVQDSSGDDEVYQVDFVILCIGNFSGFPNVPEFPLHKGPKVFDGVVMHAMDYAAMDDESAAQLITGKRVFVVGFQKTALDLATEVANRNGIKNPCRLVFRTAHWIIPESFTALTFRGFNRFSEMMVHKPHRGFFQCLVTLFLSPLIWMFSKMVEIFLRMAYPLKKYNILPSYGFVQHMFSCGTAVTPQKFFDRVKEGSIVPSKFQKLSFCKKGLIIEDDKNHVGEEKADIVIFATGYKPDEKLKKIFSSLYFKKCVVSSSAPFYRECIHPKIPKLAILGYADSAANIYTTEMKSRWVAHFLAGKFKLPSVREMEQDSIEWEKCKKRYAGSAYKRYCATSLLQIHINDLLCNDMGYNPKRKSWFLAELFAPYGPTDYKL